MRADRALDHLAGVRRLELQTIVAALVAFGMVLIRDGLLGDFGRGAGQVRGSAEDSRGAGNPQRVLQQ